MGVFEIVLCVLAATLCLGWISAHHKARKAQRRISLLGRSFLVLAILLVTVVVTRVIVVEPFRIPSASMLPTLRTGDIISVSKSAYGVRVPWGRTVLSPKMPKRGDVIVFDAPALPGQFLVKRVIGLPGDIVEYRERTLMLNGKVVEYVRGRSYIGTGSDADMTGARQGTELLPGHPHALLPGDGVIYSRQEQGRWRVPPGQLFVMGDNRDNSDDSRHWGFVHLNSIRGRAHKVLVNIDEGFETGRSGTQIN